MTRRQVFWLAVLGIVAGAGLLLAGERDGGMLLLAFGTGGAMVTARRKGKDDQ